MSEQTQEPEAPPEDAPPEEGGEEVQPTEVELPEGWVLVQDQPEETVVLSETQGRAQLNPAILRAEKQINGSLVNAQGATPEELTAATQAIEANVQAFLADPHAAPLEEIPTTATRMAIDPETGDAEAEEVEVNPKTVITNEGSFTEEEWAGRARTDTVVTEDGQTFYSGVGENTEAIDETLGATAEASAGTEVEATKDSQAEGVETEQIIYSTADNVDSPGQSAGGTLLVPAGTETVEEAAVAMAETSAVAENERVAGGADEEGAGQGSAEATPAAQKAAADLGVDLASVEGTGEGGKITKSDVEAVASNS
ncbi:MAG TPA: E3 binding domain-containing protein [Myxococcales bacterium]|nr:E3 binding domain-containing protein [Myxococcales bacterium]